MKQNRRPSLSSGFTIVEVMIVLAVTTLLFISIIALVNGKQQEAQFHTAISNVQSQIQQVINETASGYYPTANIDCSLGGGSGALTITDSAGATGQGAHGDCVFLGKAIHYVSGSNSFTVYSFAGQRSATITDSVGQLYTARPTVITQATQTLPLENGLTVHSMKYVTGGTVIGNAGSMAFMQSFGPASAAGSSGSSGSQNLDLVMPTQGASTINNPNEITTLQTAFQTTQAPSVHTYVTSADAPTTGAQICFTSGTTQESGLLTIGDSLNGLSVQLKIFQTTGCT